jgi:hypothetical protein
MTTKVHATQIRFGNDDQKSGGSGYGWEFVEGLGVFAEDLPG